MSRIIFFNHFHRGDLFTHKEFVRDIKRQLPEFDFQYWHFNHPKVNFDLEIPLTNIPDKIPNTELFLHSPHDDTLLVNTWIGVHREIFDRNGGVNLNSLHESWQVIYDGINKVFGTNLVLNAYKYRYMPTINFSKLDLSSVKEFIHKFSGRPRLLLCNGAAMSNQSFNWDMTDMIKELAVERPLVDIICTKKFDSESIVNIFFTDDIIASTDEHFIKPHWMDREVNNCDLNEISYLSEYCDAIIGKNSGPFVFCETRNNYSDMTKTIISFSRGSNESMSHDVPQNSIAMRCKYSLITDHSPEFVKLIIGSVLTTL